MENINNIAINYILDGPSISKEINFMLKKLCKKLSMLLVCSSILVFNAVPAFASSNSRTNLKATTTVTTSNTVLTDGSSCTQTISSGNIGIFTINVSDYDLRNLTIASNIPVRSYILPENSGLQNFIQFQSGDYRMFNMIQWHFMPGTTYDLLVIPQSTAQVTVSMSKTSGGGASWVNMGNFYSISEQNMLMGGQTEVYGIAFQTPGKYRITVKTVTNLTATFCDSLTPSQARPVVLSNNTYVFDNLTIYATGQVQNDYAIMLSSNDPVNSGGAYTVTIEKIS